MKVYFTGAHSCGKSTLCRYVSKKYNLPMISETARMILSEQELQIDTLRYDIDIANNYQWQVFNRQLLEEQKYSEFVSDRSLIDVFAYTAQHTTALKDMLASSELMSYINVLNSSDAFIFFVRPAKATLKADGVREVINWDGIVAIDAMLKLLLQMFGLKYFSIDTENMQERTQLIDSVLSL